MWRIAFLTVLSVLSLTIPIAGWARIALFGFLLFMSTALLFMEAIGDTEKLLNELRQQHEEE